MKRAIVLVGFGLMFGTAASLGLFAAVGRTASQPNPVGPPIGPQMAPDSGAGELLLVVLGGVYPTRVEAETANQQTAFGDLAGYYVVPVAQFQGFKEQVGSPGNFALVSAFRTEAGAEEFVRLAQSFGYPATILPNRVRSLGGLYTGLGQEENPDGSGPLAHPIPESLP